MATTSTATREPWLAARKELLELEKELTHRSDEIAERRRQLPRVRIDKPYEFECSDGTRTLAELFELEDGVVYHTYTCFDRGTDVLNGTWQLLDRTPKGRDVGAAKGWPRRKDEY